MPLVGIVAKKKDIQAIKRELQEMKIEMIEITKESIENIKNIKFEEIIFLEDINLSEYEYKFMSKIISNTEYLILNEDVEINILKEMKIEKPIKIITFGFNSKATITISSIKDDKMIVCIQRDIEKINGKIIEVQENEIDIRETENKKIYNKLVIFITKELHNL